MRLEASVAVAAAAAAAAVMAVAMAVRLSYSLQAVVQVTSLKVAVRTACWSVYALHVRNTCCLYNMHLPCCLAIYQDRACGICMIMMLSFT